jgi:hypothetical protein
MPSIKKKLEKEHIEEKIDPVKYLQSLDLEAFTNCDTTREILLYEHRDNFEKILMHNLEYIYETYNVGFRDEKFFGKDWKKKKGEAFANMIYNCIAQKHDLSLFYRCPSLASELFK